MSFTRVKSLLDLTTSNLTSNPQLIADANAISLSLVTQTADTNYAIHVSNANGWTSAIPENSWSTATTIGAQGPFILEPGFRWVRAKRPSASSATIEMSYSVIC